MHFRSRNIWAAEQTKRVREREPELSDQNYPLGLVNAANPLFATDFECTGLRHETDVRPDHEQKFASRFPA